MPKYPYQNALDMDELRRRQAESQEDAARRRQEQQQTEPKR